MCTDGVSEVKKERCYMYLEKLGKGCCVSTGRPSVIAIFAIAKVECYNNQDLTFRCAVDQVFLYRDRLCYPPVRLLVIAEIF